MARSSRPNGLRRRARERSENLRMPGRNSEEMRGRPRDACNLPLAGDDGRRREAASLCPCPSVHPAHPNEGERAAETCNRRHLAGLTEQAASPSKVLGQKRDRQPGWPARRLPRRVRSNESRFATGVTAAETCRRDRARHGQRS